MAQTKRLAKPRGRCNYPVLMPIDKAELGRLIRGLRKGRKLTQGQLGARASVDTAQVSAYELGKELPGTETLSRLLAALDIDLLELLKKVAGERSEADKTEKGPQSGNIRPGESPRRQRDDQDDDAPLSDEEADDLVRDVDAMLKRLRTIGDVASEMERELRSMKSWKPLGSH